MSATLGRAGTFLKIQRVSLVVGAFYDGILVAVLLLVPELMPRWFGLPLPNEEFYLWILAVLLAMVTALYLLAAYDPMAYAGNVLVAIAGRGAAGAALALAAASGEDLAGLYALSAVDLLFAAVHAVCWRATRGLRSQLL